MIMMDTSELQEFLDKIDAGIPTLHEQMAEFLDDVGEKFLDLVQEQIEKADNVEGRTLLSSFEKGAANGIYELDEDGLTLTVSTKVKYADWVNSGHKQKPGRFVPGRWVGERFIYEPGSKTGMVLKASFVKGSGYFDKAVSALKKMFPQLRAEMVESIVMAYF